MSGTHSYAHCHNRRVTWQWIPLLEIFVVTQVSAGMTDQFNIIFCFPFHVHECGNNCVRICLCVRMWLREWGGVGWVYQMP